MTITLYVNWEDQEVYQNEEELIEGYIEHYRDEDDFKGWLDENYSSDEIFDFTEHQKIGVKRFYQEYLLKSAQSWAYDNNMKQEIEI